MNAMTELKGAEPYAAHNERGAQRGSVGKLSVVELLAKADQIRQATGASAACEFYNSWLDCNRDNALRYAILFNYAVALSDCGQLELARDALSEVISLNSEFLPAYINMGAICERNGATGDAIIQWQKVINKLRQITADAFGYKLTALKQIGRVLESVQFDSAAEETLRQSLDLNPSQRDVIQHWFSLRQRQCKWPIIKPWGHLTRQDILEHVSPLSLAIYTDDPAMQLGNAYRYCKLDIGRPPHHYMETHATLRDQTNSNRLRVGYLSTDLREHAIGYLAAEIFELHDSEKFEIFVYYCGHRVSDAIQSRIKDAAEHWIDISEMSDEEAAEQIIADRVGILVDLNGYTHGARTRLLSMRPAPVVVNWLGFPGSAGSPYHNYIIADDFIIPPENEVFFSERVMRLPCYQPNDRKRSVSTLSETRSDVGLPEHGMVYCCFNGAHKFSPFTWRRWMEILRQTPGSVLWLLDGVADTIERLRELAVEHGIDAGRLIFARKLRNPDHLARYHLADLFLDTSPYGAHTTASDALWMGVPVLTLAGRGFAARVCGSLVRSAGLPELVCTRPEDYVALAVELGKNREALAAIRLRLRSNRDTCVLFDTPLLISRIENLFDEMWADFLCDRVHRPDLTNLEIYNEIGAELDDDGRETVAVPDYRTRYVASLTARDQYSKLSHDRCLWPKCAGL